MSDIKESIRKLAETLDNGFENTWARVFGIILAIGIAVPLFIALVIALSLWSAWGVVTLWGWYAVPLGAPIIGYWHAAGISLLLHMLKPQLNIKSEGTSLIGAIVRPPVYVFFGYIFKVLGGF